METYVNITERLPSKCIIYPDKTEIQIRTFKGKDEKLISELSMDNFDKKFATILTSVIKGIDPLKLTVGDRMYLMLWETINSYSKDFTVEYECEHCWKKAEYKVDLSALESIQLSKDFKEPYIVKLSSESLNLRLWKVDDLIKVNEMEKANQNVWLYRYALSIVNGKQIWDNVSYLENLDSKDLMIIRAFHDKFAHGPKMETKYDCPNCGGSGVMPIPFRLEMLLPFGKELARYTGNAI